MATYDQYEKIFANNTDFEKLRQAINNIITNRTTGLGNSAFTKYSSSQRDKVANSVTETQNVVIDANPFVNGLSVIQDLLKKGYMKPEGTSAQQTAANRIKNANVYDQYSIIPALTDAFTVVNYWNTGSEGSSKGCNGACTGYCDGNCGGTELTIATSSGGSGGCTDCKLLCITMCETICTQTCEGNCYGDCKHSCSTICAYACNENCGETCSGECGSGCSITCSNSCSRTCQNACSSCGACAGGCWTQCSGCTSACGDQCSSSCTGVVGPE